MGALLGPLIRQAIRTRMPALNFVAGPPAAPPSTPPAAAGLLARSASCSGSFCGYCHKAVATARGCHDHVRECDMNLTANGSYYADAPVIREAQRRYRVKRLKQFLRSGEYKKEVQNAIVFTLSADLKDLGIDPAALFDVGNLQGDEAAR